MSQLRRVPSNRVPAYVPPRLSTGPAARAIFVCVMLLAIPLAPIALGIYLFSWESIVAVLGFLIAVVAAGVIFDSQRQRALKLARANDSLCTFARSFNCRTIDTWIIRSVYEEASKSVSFPIRPEDHLENDLGLEGIEVEEFVRVVTQRTGRSFDSLEQNPLFGKVLTVRQLVEFCACQPRV